MIVENHYCYLQLHIFKADPDVNLVRWLESNDLLVQQPGHTIEANKVDDLFIYFEKDRVMKNL